MELSKSKKVNEPSLPRISVVIPHLNQPDHLDNCLQSLHRQSVGTEDVEITVIDNGSKKLPTEICARYGNVRLIEESTPGPGPTRNKGIASSAAPNLAFIDADCIADENWLAAIADAFENPETQIIGGDVRISLADPNRMSMLEAYESVYAYRQRMYIERQGFSGTGNLAMRRDVYEAVGPFAGITVAEDREWGQRAKAMGYVIRYLPEMRVFHPARKTFSELCTKWDRHIAHDYVEQVHGVKGQLVWLAKAAALAVSPSWEFWRILRSERLRTRIERLKAFFILVRIRIYRAVRAIEALIRIEGSTRSHDWNRN